MYHHHPRHHGDRRKGQKYAQTAEFQYSGRGVTEDGEHHMHTQEMNHQGRAALAVESTQDSPFDQQPAARVETQGPAAAESGGGGGGL